MARQQSPEQKETVARVMHEFKHGELETRGNGPKVKNPKQAIAIALHEAGATNQESPDENRKNLKRTKGKERRGETAEAETEGKRAQDRTMHAYAREGGSGGGGKAKSGGAKSRGSAGDKTKGELYAEARKRGIPGRSKMSRAALERALGH